MSLGKYVKRMSSVFKKEKSSKASDLTAPGAPSVVEDEQQNVKKEATEEKLVPAAYGAPRPHQINITLTSFSANAPTEPSPSVPTDTITSTKSPSTPTIETKQLDRHAMQQERARALFAKYGLTLDTHEWIAAPAPMPTVQRVEKSIRMRVHRNCHHCGTIYGPEKVCLQCEHKRCKKCPRFPKKKQIMEKEKEKVADEKPKKKRVLTITTRGGNELAYQPSKQRVRRTCHKCETVFAPSTATICEQCRHIRCTKCPREPAKLQKWPDGYPGDVEADSDSEVEKQLEKFRRTWRKPRQRVKWECEQCQTSFISGSPTCPGCGHERCEKCTRLP
jgi:hypothetical protein